MTEGGICSPLQFRFSRSQASSTASLQVTEERPLGPTRRWHENTNETQKRKRREVFLKKKNCGNPVKRP